MNYIGRIKKRNAPAVQTLLQSLGIKVHFDTAPTHIDGGCSDPSCCNQHPNPEEFYGVWTDKKLSGKDFHRIIKHAILQSDLENSIHNEQDFFAAHPERVNDHLPKNARDKIKNL